MSGAHEAYLADWKAKHTNIVEPEYVNTRPNMTDAVPMGGYRIWGSVSRCFALNDGRVLEVGKAWNWTDCYAIFPSFEAWNSYARPMSSNEYYG